MEVLRHGRKGGFSRLLLLVAGFVLHPHSKEEEEEEVMTI